MIIIVISSLIVTRLNKIFPVLIVFIQTRHWTVKFSLHPGPNVAVDMWALLHVQGVPPGTGWSITLKQTATGFYHIRLKVIVGSHPPPTRQRMCYISEEESTSWSAKLSLPLRIPDQNLVFIWYDNCNECFGGLRKSVLSKTRAEDFKNLSRTRARKFKKYFRKYENNYCNLCWNWETWTDVTAVTIRPDKIITDNLETSYVMCYISVIILLL